jgi:predicted transcriptional regulator
MPHRIPLAAGALLVAALALASPGAAQDAVEWGVPLPVPTAPGPDEPLTPEETLAVQRTLAANWAFETERALEAQRAVEQAVPEMQASLARQEAALAALEAGLREAEQEQSSLQQAAEQRSAPLPLLAALAALGVAAALGRRAA